MECVAKYKLSNEDGTKIKTFIRGTQIPAQNQSGLKVLFLFGPAASGKSTLTKLIAHECNVKTYTLNSVAINQSYIKWVVSELESNEYGLVVVNDYRGEYGSKDFDRKKDTSLGILLRCCFDTKISLCVNSEVEQNFPKEWCVQLSVLPEVDTQFYYKVSHGES
jgi:hypothetical protein